MNERANIAILANEDNESSIVEAIAAQTQEIRVTRRCADVAEMRAVSEAGVASIGIIDGQDPDVDALLIADLHRNGMQILVLASPDYAERMQGMGADKVVQAEDISSIISDLLILATEENSDDGQETVHTANSIKGHLQALDVPQSTTTTVNPTESDDGKQVTRLATTEEKYSGHAEIFLGDSTEEKMLGKHSAYSRSAEFTVENCRDQSTGTQVYPVQRRGVVIAVWGTDGAPGRSTLAVNIATALRANGSVLLVDSDLRAPSISHMLNVHTDYSGIAILARNVSRGISVTTELPNIIMTSTQGVDIVTGLLAPQRWREFYPIAASKLIEGVCNHYDYTVMDCAAVSLDPVSKELQHRGGRDDVTAAILRSVDHTLIVSRCDVVGITRFSLAWKWRKESGITSPSSIVINKLSRHSAGKRPINSVANALSPQFSGHLLWGIPEEPTMNSSLLRGNPLIVDAPDSPAARAIKDLRNYLVGELRPVLSGDACN